MTLKIRIKKIRKKLKGTAVVLKLKNPGKKKRPYSFARLNQKHYL